MQENDSFRLLTDEVVGCCLFVLFAIAWLCT